MVGVVSVGREGEVGVGGDLICAWCRLLGLPQLQSALYIDVASSGYSNRSNLVESFNRFKPEPM